MRLRNIVFALLSLLCSLNGYAQRNGAPLQIILIVADDLGWKDVGFMGSRYYKTPNLDKLARRSVMFTNAYANASNCAPSRACLLTGTCTPRHGVYTVDNSERGNVKTRKIIPIPNRADLDTSTVTFAEVLNKAGFRTALYGKWHLGKDPRQHGFDVHKGGGKAGSPKSYFSPYHLDYLSDGPTGEELTDRLTTEAVDYVATNRTNPFLLYLPYFAIHTPLQGKPALVDKYTKLAPFDGQGTNAHYSALIENLDSNVGRLMRSIDSLKLKNVLVIFTSDNGGIASLSRQWPLRAGKGSYYEGGIRVPLLIYDSRAGQVSRQIDTPVQLADLYPTITERAGITASTSQQLDGQSLLPLLRGVPAREWQERPIFWHFPIYLEAYQVGYDDGQEPVFRTRPGSAVRMGPWKLIQYFENNELELYDLVNDPGERVNLVQRNPEQAQRMFSVLQNLQQRMKAPIPTQPNPAYDPAFVSKQANKPE